MESYIRLLAAICWQRGDGDEFRAGNREAIVALTPREMSEIYSWLDEQMVARVDAAIARDLDAGVFDEDIRIALAGEKAGKVRGLSGWS